MIDSYKVGNQIALLRKSMGFTGEKLAELLGVTPQAVSKWENGKCLPESLLLPLIADTLSTSIDALLSPRELVILDAKLSDGVTAVDVTRVLNSIINGNKLYLAVNAQFMGVTIDSNRVKVLTVKYQTPEGIYLDYKLENEYLSIDLANKSHESSLSMEIIGAYYGNKNDYRDCMTKIKHYDYFNWDEIHVNHERFPSSPKADETEYLSLIYINEQGIHVISCKENETLCYSKDKTDLCVKDTTVCILPNIEPLEWEKGIDCTWAGAVLRALNYMGENYTYEQIMGMSGACYRIAFTDVWDWSAVDALVAYDYSTILFQTIGYEQLWADRINKDDRSVERQRIVADIRKGKPVIAINLRIAPEWGVITGYKEDGKILLCRTYFDKEFLNDDKDYLESDFWPFLITHFGEKGKKPSEYETLIISLKTLQKSYHAPCERGYYQGKEAYEQWISGLENDENWNRSNTTEVIDRRIGVNDATLLNLIDARRCAAEYLNNAVSLVKGELQEQLRLISGKYGNIVELLADFRCKSKQNKENMVHYNEIDAGRNNSAEFRRGQVALLKGVLEAEAEIEVLAGRLLVELINQCTIQDC
jgi:DNA-binding XRE family transcriptional regulator